MNFKDVQYQISMIGLLASMRIMFKIIEEIIQFINILMKIVQDGIKAIMLNPMRKGLKI